METKSYQSLRTKLFSSLCLFAQQEHYHALQRYPLKDALNRWEYMETLPDWAVKEMEEEQGSIAQNLHFVSFRKELRTHEAESALAQLGLMPATLTETLLFMAIYGDNIHISPILALNAYHDLSGSLESIFKSYSRPPMVCASAL